MRGKPNIHGGDRLCALILCRPCTAVDFLSNLHWSYSWLLFQKAPFLNDRIWRNDWCVMAPAMNKRPHKQGNIIHCENLQHGAIKSSMSRHVAYLDHLASLSPSSEASTMLLKSRTWTRSLIIPRYKKLQHSFDLDWCFIFFVSHLKNNRLKPVSETEPLCWLFLNRPPSLWQYLVWKWYCLRIVGTG